MSLDLLVQELGAGGDGAALTPGGKIHLPFTLPGETVRANVEGSRGAVLEILSASPSRIAPVCRHFGACGGCALQHLEHGAYLAWKRGRVEGALRQRGVCAPVDPVWAVPAGARRRAVFTAVKRDGAVQLGFHRAQSHDVVNVTQCPVLAPPIVAALPALRDLLALVAMPAGGLRVSVLAAENGLDVRIDAEGGVKSAALAPLAKNAAAIPEIVRLSIGGETLIARALPQIAAGGVAIIPPPGAFVQAAKAAEDEMARLVLEGAGRAKNVADLYCGLGAFTFPLARRAKVTAVEYDLKLLGALEAAARGASGLKPITALRRDLEREPLSAMELNRFDAAIFDPPRAGAMAQAGELARSKLTTIVAVSCNPASFARDARILVDGGFTLTRVAPIDQFLFSPHVEIVANFRR